MGFEVFSVCSYLRAVLSLEQGFMISLLLFLLQSTELRRKNPQPSPPAVHGIFLETRNKLSDLQQQMSVSNYINCIDSELWRIVYFNASSFC